MISPLGFDRQVLQRQEENLGFPQASKLFENQYLVTNALLRSIYRQFLLPLSITHQNTLSVSPSISLQHNVCLCLLTIYCLQRCLILWAY